MTPTLVHRTIFAAAEARSFERAEIVLKEVGGIPYKPRRETRDLPRRDGDGPFDPNGVVPPMQGNGQGGEDTPDRSNLKASFTAVVAT